MVLPVVQTINYNREGSPAAQHIAQALQKYCSLSCGENVLSDITMAPGIDGPTGDSVGDTT